jgi:NAD(P)-dependent dehydrogenase (short-subunit alcohol dehydrogenase family)
VETLLVFGARNLGRVLARELSAKGWRVAAGRPAASPTIEQLKDEVPEGPVGLIADVSNADESRAYLRGSRPRRPS